MNALFLAALIIACAAATSVPSALLGYWSYESESGDCGTCIYQSLNFYNSSNNGIILDVAAQGPCNGTYLLNNIFANATSADNVDVSLTLASSNYTILDPLVISQFNGILNVSLSSLESTCITYFDNNVVSVPSVLLGTWNYDSQSATCNSSCTYQSLTFTAGADSTITLNVTATGTSSDGSSCSGSYVLQGVIANETLAPNSYSGFTLYDSDDSDFTISISQVEGAGLNLSFSPGTSAYYCNNYFGTQSANLMKATVGTIIAAIVMLF